MRQIGHMGVDVTEAAPGVDGGERMLWCAVLQRGIDDALGASRYIRARPAESTISGLNQRAACAWIGTRNFYIVCHLAGPDPEAVLDRLRPQLMAAE